MAQKMDARTWHTVQHEGFHQFAHVVIRGDLPIWVNEGLAEYFGEAVFTGDGFVSGVIPPTAMTGIRRLPATRASAPGPCGAPSNSASQSAAPRRESSHSSAAARRR